jgi:hypothetical protein
MPSFSYPTQQYKQANVGGTSSYGSTTIPSGASKVTVDCGALTGDSVVRIFQTATSASTDGQIFEVKYDNSLPVRLTGNNGQFVVGSFSAHQIFTLTPDSAPDGGTFTVTFDGSTTDDIEFDATAEEIQAALEALDTIGTGGVVVTGTMATAVVITFSGTMLRVDVAAPTCTSSLTDSAAPDAVTVTDDTNNFTNAVTIDWLVTPF